MTENPAAPDLKDSQAWSHFNHHTPEAFWDVAVWPGNGNSWITGSLDVADRKRIALAVMAAMHKPAEAAAAAETDVYVVTTPRGFTETFTAHQIETLVRLGLIEHERDGYVLEGAGEGVGPIHHFYREVAR